MSLRLLITGPGVYGSGVSRLSERLCAKRVYIMVLIGLFGLSVQSVFSQ
jgi:hypothetical protein